MKRFIKQHLKAAASALLCVSVVVNLLGVPGLAVDAGPSPVTLDFRSAETASSTQQALSYAYDFPQTILADPSNPRAQANAFTRGGQAWYTDADGNHVMLSLTYWALGSLSKDEDIADPGYYISYNVEGGSAVGLTSVYVGSIADKVAKAGLETKFRFETSPDYVNWTPVEPDIATADFTSKNGYNKKDTYTLTVPAGARFVRVGFPQRRNLSSVINHPGNYQFGTIETLTYTPAATPAAPLEKYVEPALSYGRTVDFTDSDSDLSAALANMYSYTPGVLSVTNADYTDLGTGAVYPLLSLTAESLKGKAPFTPLYNMVYAIEPGTPFRLESLHRERESEKITDKAREFRFRFYTSPDGAVWTPCEPAFYGQTDFSTKKIDNKNYDNLDTYVVEPPDNARFVKVEFPQDRDNSVSANAGASMGNYGDWAVATVKNIRYTPASVPPPRTINFLHSSGLPYEFSKMYDYTPFAVSAGTGDVNAFALGEAVYVSKSDGKSYPMLSLAYNALSGLPTDADAAAYSITYNVEGGSPFQVVSDRNRAASDKIAAKGLEYKLQISVSSDFQHWTEVTDYDFSTGPSGAKNPYDSEDVYHLNVPDDAKFVRLTFPQTRNLSAALGAGNVGNWQIAAVRSLTYTPAVKPAEPLSPEPEKTYAKTVDFTQIANDANTFLSSASSFTEDAFTTSEAEYSGTDGSYTLFSLKEDALSGKSAQEPLEPKACFAYPIQPGTAVRLESLRSFSPSNKMANRGLRTRFRFYSSEDGENWAPVDDVWYHAGYAVSEQYDVLDTYVAQPPASARYIKVEFPQSQDCRLGTADKENPVVDKNTVGSKEVGTIRTLAFSPAVSAGASRTDDFSALKKFMPARDLMYDASPRILSDDEKAADAAVFDVGESYFKDASTGAVTKLLGLTYEALLYLPTDKNTEGYYVTYNVEPGTLFKFDSLRTSSAESVMKRCGLSYKFRILTSPDNRTWTELGADGYSLRTGAPEVAGNYEVLDGYSFFVPESAKFVKLVFPQVRNLATDKGFGKGSVGNWQCGTVRSVTYTPAVKPAPALRTEPKYSYKETVDFSTGKETLATTGAYTLSLGALSLTESYYSIQSVDEEGKTVKTDYPLLSLTYFSLYQKESLDPLYSIVYNVEPGTPLRLDSLRNYSTANKVAKKGRSVLFKIYLSSDFKNWTPADTEIYTSYFESMQSDTEDVYVVPTTKETKFVKIEFPQRQDNSDVFGGSPGNYQFGLIKSIRYTPAAHPAPRPAIPSEYDPGREYGGTDLTAADTLTLLGGTEGAAADGAGTENPDTGDSPAPLLALLVAALCPAALVLRRIAGSGSGRVLRR